MAGWDFLDTLDSPQPKEVDGNWSFLDTLDSPQKPIARQPSGESFQDVSNRSLLDEFALGINRGTEQLKSSLYGFGGIVGSIIGNESLKQAGFKGFQEHEAEAAKYPKAVNLKDVTLGTFPSLLVGTIGEVVPSMVEAAATTLAGTILGAATGTAVAPVGGTAVGAAGGTAVGAATGLAGIFARQAGRNLIKEAAESFVKKGIARETAEVMAKEEVKKIATNELVKMGARAAGSKAGMFAGVLPMESGGNWGETLKEYGIDNPWSALATGTMASFLEFAGGNSRVIRDVLGTAEESAFRKAIASADTHAITRITKKALTQGGEEAAQEMGQEFLSLANIAVNDPKFEMFTKDNMWRILESGFGGLVAGAGGGVVSGIISPKAGEKTDLTTPPDETKEQKVILNDSERKEILKYAEDKLDELNKKDVAGTITADERVELNFLKENSTSPEAIVSQYQPKAQPSISIDVLKGVGFTKEQIDKMDLPTINSTLQIVSKQVTERAKPNTDVIYDAVVDGKRGIEWHTRGGKSGFVEMGESEQVSRDSAQKTFQEAVQKEKEESDLMSKASPEEKQAYQVKSVLDRILAYFNRNAPIDPSGKEQHAKLMKGNGFQFSALRRRATGNPTDSDLKSAFKHLDSNYVGKRVRLNDGREAVVVSGKGKNVTVIFSDGIQKDVSRGNIVTPKATKAEAIEYLKQKGLDEVDQLINTYKDLFPEVFEQTKEQRKVKRITGLSPELSQLLVDNGITSEQAASLPPENVKAILGYLSTKKTTVPDDRKSMFNYVEKLFNGILGFNFEFNYFDFNLKDPIDVTTPEGVARLKELGHTLEGVLKALGVTYEQLKSKGGRISIAIQGRHHTVQGVDNRRTQSCWVFKGSDSTTVIHEALHGYWRERGFQGWNANEETVNLWLEKQFNGREFKDKADFEDWLEQKRNEFNATQPKAKEESTAGTKYKTGEVSRAPPGFKSLQERAAEIFGHTEFFEEAGFINNNGNLLDFSGRNLPIEQRHPGGYRALEHRYISWITGEEHPVASIWKYLLTGAIRVDGKMGAIELGERPTLEQIDKIYTLAEKFNGNLVVDLHEWKNVPEKPDYGFLLNNDRLWGDQYDKGTSPQKIISDINKFYDCGTPVVKHINYKIGELSLDERLKGVPEKFKDKPVILTHWSHKRGLRTLNPKYFGTGFAGQERERFGKGYVPQMYYGVKGYTKEHGLGKETYKGLVEGNDLYNRDYDPLNLMPTPKDLTRRGLAPFDQNEKHNLYDRRIKEAGYKGMYSETYDVVCMFVPVDVEQVKPRQTAYKTGKVSLEQDALKYDTEEEFVTDIINKNTRRISVGLSPGSNTSLSKKLSGKEIPIEEARKEIKRIADLMGVIIVDKVEGIGGWMQYIEGSIQIDVLASPEAVRDFRDAIGYAFQQTEMLSSRAIKSGSLSAVTVSSARLNNINDIRGFFSEFLKVVPKREDGTPIVEGFSQIKYGDSPAIQFINRTGKWSKKEIEDIRDSIIKANDEFLKSDIDIIAHNVEAEFIVNKWEEKQNGEAYILSLRERGRLQEARLLEHLYAPSRFDIAGDGSFLWGGKRTEKSRGENQRLKTGEITLLEDETDEELKSPQKIVLEQAKRAAAPKKEYVFTPKKNVPLTVQRNIPPEFQDVVYETIANDEEIAKADSIMTSKEAVIRYATHPELIPAGIRKTAAMVSAINFAQKLNDPELFMILGGKDSFLKYSSYVAQELQLLRELYKDSPAIAIREINIVRETEAVKKDSNIKQRAKEQTNVGKQTVKADVNRSINKEATRRLIDLIKC